MASLPVATWMNGHTIKSASYGGARELVDTQLFAKKMNASKLYLPALSSSRFPPALLVVIYHVVLAYYVLGNMDFLGLMEASSTRTPTAQSSTEPVDTSEGESAEATLAEDKNLREGLAEFQAWCRKGAAVFEESYLLRNYLRGAAVTLSFFFTLSGFILAYTYLSPGRTPPLDRREFWVNRLARVYPVYGLALVISFPLFLIMQATRQPKVGLEELLYNGVSTIFLMQSWYPGSVHAWNPPGWSLSCEAFFYLLFPWLILWIDRRSSPQLVSIIAGCWVLSLTPPLLYSVLEPDGIETVTWTSEEFWLFVVKFNPLVRLPEFVSGVALGKLFLQRSAVSDSGLVQRGGWMSVGATAVVLATCAVADSLSFLLLHNGLLTPVFAVMIYGLALQGGLLARGLARPFMALLGDATYALYILHFSIIWYLMVILAIARGRLMSPTTFLLACLFVGVIIAIPTYRYFEIPMRRVIRRRLQRSAST